MSQPGPSSSSRSGGGSGSSGCRARLGRPTGIIDLASVPRLVPVPHLWAVAQILVVPNLGRHPFSTYHLTPTIHSHQVTAYHLPITICHVQLTAYNLQFVDCGVM